jgi:septum formation protein
VNESRKKAEAPQDYVLRLAAAKAVSGWRSLAEADRAPVLGADTVVVIDGEILGKPADATEAGDMLAKLSGRSHEVLSAVCISDGALRSRMSRSTVTFRAIDDAEREAYCATSEPLDKAGGYAIQGLAAVFVSRLEGSYSGVMGLPLFETAELLSELGMDLLRPRREPRSP